MLRHTRILTYVDEVARQGSIRRAAERLNVAPSAVQRRIADIEADLGVALFERTKTGMRPTAAGEAFVAWVRRQATEFDRVRSQIEDLQGLQSGTIRISCSQAIAAGFLPAEIARFRLRYPDIVFQITVQSHAAAYAGLASYDSDLALVFRPEQTAGISVIAVLEQRVLVVMREDHALSSGATVRLYQCAEYPIALLDQSFGSRQIIDGALLNTATRFKFVLESNSFELLRRFVALTDGISFQIEAGVPQEPGLTARPIDDRDRCGGPLVLAKLEGRSLPVATEVFSRQIASHLNMLRPSVNSSPVACPWF
jgi:DNA-binding transcriptional LysR family regulator